MATILIADDRDIDRQYLATLLGYYGHRILLARDGVQALQETTRERPDLIISDVVMSVLDGYEFVRRLRGIPDVAATPVIFYTASYHEREVMTLARQCGVTDILTKPCEPAAIIAKIDAVLGRPSYTPAAPPPAATFEREHLRVVSDKLVQKVHDLEASEHRLAAVISLCHRFTSELDPVVILNHVCECTREVTLAQHAFVALVDEQMTSAVQVVSSGVEPTGWRLTFPDASLDPLFKDRAPVRRSDGSGAAAATTLRSYLAVPIVSVSRVHGWIGLQNKLGADAFSVDDERVAGMVAAEAGVAYENARLVEELRRQATTLRTNEARTEYALEAGRMGVWELDLATERVIASGMESVFGLGPGQAPKTRRTLLDIVYAGDRNAVLEAMEQTIRTDRELAMEFRAAPGNGTRWVYCRAQMRREEGRAARLLGVVMDINERKLLEAQLLQAQKMEALGQLAGGVAHDFNNLLTAILGYSNLVVDTLDDDDERRSSIGEVIHGAERAATLTRQLLTFSRKHVVQPVLVDLNGLIEGMRPMLCRLIGSHIEVATELAPQRRLVRADPGQIEQVIMNLAVNSRDAMVDSGRLTISTTAVDLDEEAASGLGARAGTYVMLSVADSGAGMTEETKRHLFEPFYTTKGPGKGTGLGLAMVYGIVKQTEGAIAVESAPGLGATFRLYFPVSTEKDQTATASPTTDTPATGTETVLVVEDDGPVRFLTRAMLERAGYTVLEAANAAEAEALCAGDAQPFDLLLTDVMMPGASGPALFERLVTRRPGLKVLFISGYTDDTIGHHGLLRPGLHFLEKPFTARTLRRKVREVIDEPVTQSRKR